VTEIRFLLDTNICILIRQNRSAAVSERFRALRPREAAISVISYGELAFGAQKSQRREFAQQGLRDLLQFLPVLSLPDSGAPAYGAIRATLERQGRLISSNDLWIAAHAIAAGLILVTNNEREFGALARPANRELGRLDLACACLTAPCRGRASGAGHPSRA
jgi:tRNA(fMet)-specific endonuclease VapC